MNNAIKILLAFIMAIFVGRTTAQCAWDDAFNDSSKPRRLKEKNSSSNNDANITGSLTTAYDIPPELQDAYDKMQQIDAVIPDNTSTKAVMLSTFAQMYYFIKDYVKAEAVAFRALNMAEKTAGSNSKETLICLINLAKIHYKLGDNVQAINELEKGINICKANASLSPGNLAGLYAMLAFSQIDSGLYLDADYSSRKALELDVSKLDRSNSDPVFALCSRGMSLFSLKRLDESYDCLNKASQILKPLYHSKKRNTENDWIFTDYPEVLMTMLEILITEKRVSEAEIIKRELDFCRESETRAVQMNSGTKISADRANVHNETEYLANTSILEHIRGNIGQAEISARANLAMCTADISSVLRLVESQRLGWQRKHLTFTLAVNFLSPAELADYILLWKGVVLESIIIEKKEFSANRSDAAKKNFDQLTAFKRQLAQTQLLSSSGGNQNGKAIESLKKQIFRLEQNTANSVKTFDASVLSKRINLNALKSVLYEQSALVEFIIYRKLPDRRFGEKLFGALLITKNANPIWVPLGSLSAVETLSKTLHSQIDSDTSSDKEITLTLQSLNSVLWSKIADVLPKNIKEICISPDGALNFIPFSCLLQPDATFLSQKYLLSYVSSGRDLLIQSQPISTGNISIVANPQFDSDSVGGLGNTKLALRSLELNEFSAISLPPLPGTEAEAKHLADIASVSGWKANLLKGSDATEKNLALIKAPTVLHLATHGFFLGKTVDRTLSESTRGMALKSNDAAKIQSGEAFYLNPMQQSGLALAGAQNTLKSWQRGEAPDPANDGILTAEEVVGLDLSGTWLVTLSACETGTGESQSGEGVFGLRRAFMVAGARNLLMTLWSVSDETTAKVMGDFYTEAFATGDVPRSLAKIQRAWLVKLRNEKGLLAAVRDAGPFVMATTGMLIANPTLSVDKQTKFSR